MYSNHTQHDALINSFIIWVLVDLQNNKETERFI